jgi:hypothetical protein
MLDRTGQQAEVVVIFQEHNGLPSESAGIDWNNYDDQ